MITTSTTPAQPAAPPGGSRLVPAGFLLSGVLLSLGGPLHPRGSGETVDDYLMVMMASPTWRTSHVLMLVGTVVAVATFVVARREQTFGPRVSRWLTVAAAGWSLAAVELVPHLLATADRTNLATGGSTPLLDAHLLLQMFATPAVGICGAALAIAVARDAGTRPARVLAGLATLGGVAYAFAGPLINLTGSVDVTPLFIAQAAVALWLLATGVRLLRPARR